MNSKVVRISLSAIFVLSIAVLPNLARAQSFSISSLQWVKTDGSLSSDNLFLPSHTIRVNWSTDVSGAALFVGTSAGSLSSASATSNVTATSLDFSPGSVGLGVGQAFGQIRSSDGRASNTFSFYVESGTPPTVSVVRDDNGNVTAKNPRFIVSKPSGVASVVLGMSSTQFELEEDDEGTLVSTGGTATWVILSSKRELTYGETNPDVEIATLQLDEFEAPPLQAGETYYFTALNSYQINNGPISAVVGPIESFRYDGVPTLTPPVLIEPADDTDIREEEITFKWDPVDGATTYKVNIYRRDQTDGNSVDLAERSLDASDQTSLTASVKSFLVEGRYSWEVVASDDKGNRMVSGRRVFDYVIPSIDVTFRYFESNSDGNFPLRDVSMTLSNIEGAEIDASAPNADRRKITMPLGSWSYRASKPGYVETWDGVYFDRYSGGSTSQNVYLSRIPLQLSAKLDGGDGPAITDGSVTLKSQDGRRTYRNVAYVSNGSLYGYIDGALIGKTYDMTVSVPGYETHTQQVSFPTTQEYLDLGTIALTPAPLRIEGRLVNDLGEAVPYSYVLIRQDDANRTRKWIRSELDGSFVADMTAGKVTITNHNYNFSADPLVLEGVAGEALNPTMVLTPKPLKLFGWVTFNTSTAATRGRTVVVPAFDVTVTPETGDPIVVSGTNGRFEVTLPGTIPSSYQVTVTEQVSGLQITSDAQTVSFNTAGQQRWTSFRLPSEEATAAVSGRVVTVGDNEPVGGAWMYVRKFQNGRWRWTPFRAFTDSEGRYEIQLPSLSPESYQINTWVRGYDILTRNVEVSLGVGQKVNQIDFTIRPGAATIAGTIVDQNNTPIRDATVSIIRDAARNPLSREAVTDLSGRFQMQIAAGRYRVRADKVYYESNVPQILTVGPGAYSGRNVLQIRDISSYISGRTEPETRIEATLIKRTADDPDISFVENTGESGNFNLRVLSGYAYRVSVSKPKYFSLEFDTEILQKGVELAKVSYAGKGSGNVSLLKGGVVDIVLTPAPSVASGTVFNNNGAPIPETWVVAYRSGVAFDSTLTTSEGTYDLGLGEGTFAVQAKAPGFIVDAQTVTSSTGAELDGVDFNMEEFLGTLTGRITDGGSGAGVANVLVSARGVNGAGSARTDTNGNYVIAGLYGDTYTLTVRTDGFLPVQREDVLLRGGETRDASIAMEPFSGTVSGTLSDVNGNSIAGGQVTVTHEQGQVFVATADANGFYTVGPLPLGQIDVAAERVGYIRTGLEQATISESQLEVSIDIDDFRLAGGSVTGTVIDALTSSPLQGVTVQLSGSEGAASATTDASGQFSIENLSEGSYSVTFTRDGFQETSGSVSVGQGDSITEDASLNRIQGRIVGRVTDQQGASTGFLIDVIASSSAGQFQTRSGTDGSYVISDLPAGTYQVRTDISREGFTNVEREIVIQPADTEVPLDLAMTVGTAEVSGNAGAVGVQLELVDPANNALVKSSTSTSTSTFAFRNLLPGTYRVVPSLEGFVFSPASIEVAATNGAVQTATFTATENIGSVTVSVRDGSGNALANVNVGSVSADGEFRNTRTTDETGTTTFTLTGGNEYFFSASSEGLIPDAATKSVSVAAGSSSSVTFTMSSANAAISGVVRRAGGAAIQGSRVTLRNDSGQSFTVTQDQDSFTFANMAAGTYSATAFATGFRSASRDISLSAGQDVSGVVFELQSLSVTVNGRVISSSGGVAGLTVTFQGLTELATTTDSQGRFTVADLPVQDGEDNTTVYAVVVSGENVLGTSTTLSLTGAQIGSIQTLDDLLVPSGIVDLLVTDGSNPIDAATVRLISSTGDVIEGITAVGGLFSSGRTLSAGSYELSVSAAGRMSPVSSTVIVELDSDVAEVNTTLRLPFIFDPPAEVFAASDSPVSIAVSSGYDLSGVEATLVYQFSDENVATEIPMRVEGASIRATIPGLFNLNEVSYFTRVSDTNTGVRYRSRTVTTNPSAAGVLTQSRVTPTLGGIPLRVGDTYEAQILLRDGLGEVLTDDFRSGGSGQLQWTTSDASLVIETPDPNDPTRILIKPSAAGAFSITASAQLGGAFAATSNTISVTDAPVAALTVATTSQRATNSDAGFPLSVTASLEDGSVVRLGQALEWSVSPAAAASVDGSTLVFSNPGFFGPIRVEVTDAVSSQRQSASIDVLVPIDGTTSYALTNLAGLEFDIPSGAVPVPATVGLSPERLPTPKRHARVGRETYQVEEPVFRLSLEADQAIPGDSLQAAASLTMPLVSDRFSALTEGERSIGFFDVGQIQWRSLSTSIGGNTATSNSVFRLGEFAILSANEPLGIRHAAVLPSPFSPDIAPLKIGYLLQSAAPPAVVDIEIFSLMGERVRTLLDGDVQQPGRYGSETSLRPIEWDGMTDGGQIARNGRYVIRITARDDSGEVTELIPVVLVK